MIRSLGVRPFHLLLSVSPQLLASKSGLTCTDDRSGLSRMIDEIRHQGLLSSLCGWILLKFLPADINLKAAVN